MRRLGLWLMLLLGSVSCYAQTSAVSATVVDLDGTTWANGSWKIAFTPNPAQPNINIYNINGTPLSQSVMFQNGVMDGSGNLSLTIYQNQVVSPAGSSWVITVCPNAVTQCGTYKFTANSGTLNLSSIITPIIPVPRFHPVSGSYGYNDGEAILSLQPGSTYWNVTGSSQRCYTGSAWGNCGASGGSGLNQLTNDVLAGPGTGSQSAEVVGIKNVPLCTGFFPIPGQSLTLISTSSPIPCWGAQAATAGVTAIIPGSGTNCTTLIGGQCTGNVTVTATGSGNAVSVVPRLTPAQLAGLIAAYDPIVCGTNEIDIRCWNATIDGATDIGSSVQSAVNTLYTRYGGAGVIILPCIQANGTGAGCYWANSNALTGPVAGTVKFKLYGAIQGGSTVTFQYWQSWFGQSGGPGQFQTGTVPATIVGPNAKGTLGTAITVAATPTTITPTFTSGGIANLPVGSAITIAEIGSSSATAARVPCGSLPSCFAGYGRTTVTLASSTLRIPAGKTITLNCPSDSSFNVTGMVVSNSDYTAQTVTFFQTSTTTASTTGCTITGFNEDEYESVRVVCSNGVSGTFNGVTYSSCGAGQITVLTSHTHLSTDLWGAVGAGPAFNVTTPQTISDINFGYSQGMNFWAEGSSNLELDNVGVTALNTETSGTMECSACYRNKFHNISVAATQPPQQTPPSPNGGVQTQSYPYSLRCDSDVTGFYYSSTVAGCQETNIDRGSEFTGGGIKIDGSGVSGRPVNGLPQISGTPMFEELFGAAITIDNRSGGLEAQEPLTVENPFIQDNISGYPQYVVNYTDGNIPPSGCVKIEGGAYVGGFLYGPYFNSPCEINESNLSPIFSVPRYQTGPSGTYFQGNTTTTELPSIGSGFGPQLLPFGSLPVTGFNLTSLASVCTGYSATCTSIAGPDAPSGLMPTIQIVSGGSGISATIATDTRATYLLDRYVYWSWIRPIAGQPYTLGANNAGVNNSFTIVDGYSTFAATNCSAGTATVTCPQAFGTGIAYNGWTPQVAVATILTGNTTPHAVQLQIGLASATGTGNQWGGIGWTFIPGPNNPACTAAGTCNLTADQIETVRRDYYHGCVPPGAAVGAVTTCEPVATVSTNTSPEFITSTTVGYTAGTGVSAVVCASGFTCNTNAGLLLVTAASGTPTNMFFSITYTLPTGGTYPLVCTISNYSNTASPVDPRTTWVYNADTSTNEFESYDDGGFTGSYYFAYTCGVA